MDFQRIKMDFQNSGKAERMVSEIKCIEEAIAFFYDAESITVSAVKNDEQGQKCKTERRLERAEIIEAVYLALVSRDVELLTDLKEVDPDGKHFLALKEGVASTIDPTTAETSWSYGNPFDPYGIGPDVPDNRLVDLCYVSSPGSKISIWMGYLPKETGRALRLKLAKEGVSLSALIANRADVWHEYRDVSAASPQAGG